MSIRSYLVKSTNRLSSVFVALSIGLGLALTGFVLIGLALSPHPAHADGNILRVNGNVSGGNQDGSSWSDAFTYLQDALDDAAYGDELWVAQGVYYPDEGTGQIDNNRGATFQLASGVAIYGGFAATETQRSQRDWRANVTVLSGDLGKDDITDANDVVTDTDNIAGSNAYHVATGSGVTEAARLDGFAITAGQANVSSHDYGGGMSNDNGNPTLVNLTFSGNQAKYGAGMHNDASSPTLITVTFSSNQALWGYGAGMYNDEGSHPALTAVTFTGNHAEDSGGGMYNRLSHPTLTDTIFDHNQADNNGGGMYNVDSDPTLIDVTFSDNVASCDGSGRCGGGGMYNASSSPTLSDVTFISNTSTQDGGGVYNFTDSSPRMTNVAFRGNATVDGVGGGIYSYKASITLTNALFSGNWGRHGGGIYNWLGSVVLTNATFGGNATVDNGNFHYNPGSAIFNDDGTATLVNSILWGNAGEQIKDQWASTSTISYSDVAWSGGVYTGTDNINADPQFVAPVTVTAAPTTAGDYRLQPTSPAIDAGDNSAVTGATTISTDLDGNPRRVDVPTVDDTGNGAPPIVDMGGYESQFRHVVYLPLVTRVTTFTLHNCGRYGR
jgi:hypothetical protein